MRFRQKGTFFLSLFLVFCFGYFLGHYTNHHTVVRRETTKVIAWAVYARTNDLALDNLLKSVHSAGVTVLLEERSSAMEDVLRKRHINFLVGSTSCYDSKNASKTCLSTNWMTLLQKAWNTGPDVVCFSTEDVAVDPQAHIFIKATSGDKFGGLQLSSKNIASPWCLERNAWIDFKNEIEVYCAIASLGWEEIISRLQESLEKKIAVIPSRDLSDTPNNNPDSTDGRNTAKSPEITDRSVPDSLQTQRKTLSKEMQSLVLEFWKQTALRKCEQKAVKKEVKTEICDEFKFEREEDKHIFVNKQLKNGDKAFILDLGPTCVDTSKITVSKGGEEIEDVLGRAEEDEFPKYESGALQVQHKPEKCEDNAQRDILKSAQVVKHSPTAYDVPGTTLAYTRYDYANVYHYNTDIFNVFITLQYVPAQNVLWLDGHASGNLDDIVPTLFDVNVKRIGHLNGTVCFERLVLAPRKYLVECVERFTDCNIVDYAETMWKKYNIVPSKEKYDTIIIRDYYLAHPRVTEQVSRKFKESDLEKIKKVLPDAKFIRFHELSFKEQLQTIADTRTLYGIHGAGLALGLFMEKGSTVVEWTHPSRNNSPFFPRLLSWRPDIKFERSSLGSWLNSMHSRT